MIPLICNVRLVNYPDKADLEPPIKFISSAGIDHQFEIAPEPR